MRLKLFQIITSLEPYGAQTLLLETLRLIDRSLFEPEVGYFTEGETAEAIQAIGIPTHKFELSKLVDFKCFYEIAKFMQNRRFDIVHTHMAKADFYGRTAARLVGVPVIISSIHNRDQWKANIFLMLMNRLSLQYTDELIAVSKDVKNHILSLREASSEKIVVIYNGIDPEKFKCTSFYDAKDIIEFIPGCNFVVGCIARFYEQKGHIYLIHAMKEVIKEFPKTTLVLVGDGPLTGSIREEVKRVGLSSHVVFTGRLKDVSYILSRCNLVVLPSLWEGFGLALIEGMSMEKPVVGTRVGGIPEIIEDGVVGRLVPPKDAFILSNAILEIARDSSKQKIMGTLGRKRVEELFNLHKIIYQMQDRYLYWSKKKGINKT